MQSPPSPRRRTRALRLLLVVALALAALLAFVTSTTTTTPTAAALQRTTSTTTTTHALRAVREDTATSSSSTPAASSHDDDDDAVLLPDWEVLVLLRPGAPAPPPGANATYCVFPGSGAATPARSLGRIPTSGRQAFTCAMPAPERRHNKPFRAPTLNLQMREKEMPPPPPRQKKEMLRWSGRLVYDAVALQDSTGDVVVFAKGVNPRQGVNRNASDVRCVYYTTGDDGGVVASLPAATSAQQVFRCPPPPPSTSSSLIRVTLAVAGGEPIPSMATYSPPSSPTPPTQKQKAVVCACTMVRDVAKFLREWVVYHTAVGVDSFFLYDNGSQDDLESQVRHLSAAGFHVSTRLWPWPKTQEAGFSYAAAAHRDSCDWMAFVDVDEFIFSPTWARSPKPSKSSMLQSMVAGVEPDVGQVTLGCKDFGPSGHTKHPEQGVTQGYTCRRRAVERHKSVVRLDAVEPSLMNSIHHFELRLEFRWQRWTKAQVNHYKYQAWDEFKVKFRRRVSSYVADWTEPVNHGSKDRTPGLGLEAVEPAGWAHRFCEVEDAMLADVTRRWFGVGFSRSSSFFSNGRTKLAAAARRVGPPSTTHSS